MGHTNTNSSASALLRFKTLRTLDPATLGSKPLELSPERVHFTNANGGLRTTTRKGTRELALMTVSRLLKAGINVE
jgi:hypothetical protein